MSTPRPLGVPLRPTAFTGELASSYTNRLRRRLHAPSTYLPAVARTYGLTLVQLVEVKGALLPGSLVSDAPFVDDLTGPRFECGQCTGGALVELPAHVDRFCCLEHHVWLGPSRGRVSGAPTTVVDDDTVATELAYRQLRHEGRAEAGTLTQAAWIVSAPGADARWAAPVTIENYGAVVAVVTLLTDEAFLADILAAHDSPAERRAIGTDAVRHALGPDDVAITGRLFTVLNRVVDPLVPVGSVRARLNDTVTFRAEPSAGDPTRPTARTILASRHLGATHAPRRRPHRHTTPRTAGPTATRYRARLAHSSLARCRPDLAAQWHPTLNGLVTPNQVTRSSNSQRYWWHCARCGHDWQQSTNNRARGRNCPGCAGRAATTQNCLATVDPELARQWDITGNPAHLTPSRVTRGSGRRVNWVCPLGHRYLARVEARASRRTGCPVCHNRQVIQGVNDLATTHPAIAAQWHPTRNGPLTARHVPAGSGVRAHWWCVHHHTWQARVRDRTARSSGCPVCANQVVVPGDNDLASRHPEIAATWARVAGEPPPSEVTPGSGRVLTWWCTNGLAHTFQRAVAKRVVNDNCPVCTNHVLLPGFNDVATRHPELARDWDSNRNSTRAGQTLAGNTKRWWTCPHGHTTSSSVPNRLKTGGCPRCPSSQRALHAALDRPGTER